MQAEIAQAKADGDSVGGVVECVVEGLPAGIGEPMFGGLENLIARAVFAIPAIKGVEFGAGFAAARLRGSEHNDAFRVQDGRIVTETNNCGGILGGISTGMPVVFRAAFKPTPSISRQQDSVSLSRMENTTLVIHGAARPVHRAAGRPVRGGCGSDRRTGRVDGKKEGAWICILKHCAADCWAGRSATAIPPPSTHSLRAIPIFYMKRSRRSWRAFCAPGNLTV